MREHLTNPGDGLQAKDRNAFVQVAGQLTGAATVILGAGLITIKDDWVAAGLLGWLLVGSGLLVIGLAARRQLRRQQATVQALDQRVSYISAVLDATPGFVSWFDKDFRYQGVNWALASFYGMAPEKFTGQKVGFIVGRETEHLHGFLERVFAHKDLVAPCEIEVPVIYQGETRRFLISGRTYDDGNGAVIVGIDITRQKAAERQLADREALLARLLEVLPLGLYVKDLTRSGRYVIWNPMMERISGMSAKQAIGRLDQELYEASEANRLRRIDKWLIHSDGQPLDVPEERLLRRDGKTALTHTYRVPVLGEGGKPGLILGVVEDITNDREREQQVRQQQARLFAASKLASLSDISGAVAHEINNPLAVILGHARRLILADAGPDVVHSADKIQIMSHRIEGIVRSLRAFARDADDDAIEVHLVASLVDSAVQLCSERFRAVGIDFTVESGPKDLAIECRKTQITHCLLNLLFNAFDATRPLPSRWVRFEVSDHGDTIKLAVTDAGKGIAEGLRDKLGQPFFSTKEQGKGAGLGLSTARGIAESHGGRLDYDAGSPHTRFVITLPKVQGARLSRTS